jgi:hypothetical protein
LETGSKMMFFKYAVVGTGLLCAAPGCFSSDSEPPAGMETDAGSSPMPDGGEPVDATAEGGASFDATASNDATGTDASSNDATGTDANADAAPTPEGGCGDDAGPGAFSCTGSLATARMAPGGAVLPNGKVLIAGGWNATGQTLASAEVYDPASGTFSTTGAMAGEHLWAGWASPWPVLASGKVLAAGGLAASGALLSTAELYDPAAGAFTGTGSLGTAVVAFNEVTLADGSVLLVGGYDAVTGAPPSPSFSYTAGTNQAQRYDPTSAMFASAGTLAEQRLFGCNVLLPSGKVLAIGGSQGVPTAAESNIEQFDPAMGQWTTVGVLGTGVTCSANAFILPSGSVLLDTSQLLDPVALTTTATTNSLTLTNPVFVQLANGDVLAYGGQKNGAPAADAQVYRNATGLWTTVGSLHQPRDGSRGFLLPSGDVLVVGGADSPGDALATAEIYHP